MDNPFRYCEALGAYGRSEKSFNEIKRRCVRKKKSEIEVVNFMQTSADSSSRNVRCSDAEALQKIGPMYDE